MNDKQTTTIVHGMALLEGMRTRFVRLATWSIEVAASRRQWCIALRSSSHQWQGGSEHDLSLAVWQAADICLKHEGLAFLATSHTPCSSSGFSLLSFTFPFYLLLSTRPAVIWERTLIRLVSWAIRVQGNEMQINLSSTMFDESISISERFLAELSVPAVKSGYKSLTDIAGCCDTR